IGKRIRIARPGAPWLTVVGIAGDVSDSHDPGVPLDTWYRLFDQNSASAAADHVYIMVRAAADPRSVVMDIKHAVARVDKTVAPYGMTTMDTYWAGLLSRERVSAAFMLGFGGFGLVLAALGVYGVMAFLVAQRTAEFGIRMALGAQRSDILPLVFGRGAALIGGGIAIGALLATLLNAVLSR